MVSIRRAGVSVVMVWMPSAKCNSNTKFNYKDYRLTRYRTFMEPESAECTDSSAASTECPDNIAEDKIGMDSWNAVPLIWDTTHQNMNIDCELACLNRKVALLMRDRANSSQRTRTLVYVGSALLAIGFTTLSTIMGITSIYRNLQPCGN
jgi:hypothetical protein